MILHTIKRDLDFLEYQKLMDYSLLLGIEKVNKTAEKVFNSISDNAGLGNFFK